MTSALPGFTNIVHLTDRDGLLTVTRQGRPSAQLFGIDRLREVAILRQIGHLGISPEILEIDIKRDRTTFRAIPGNTLDGLSPERAVLAGMLKVLSTLHRQPAEGKPFSAARQIRRYIGLNAFPQAIEEFCLSQALLAERLEEQAHRCLCHNDCVAKNWLLLPDSSLKLIDFEFAGPNDSAFDLATWCLAFHLDPADRLLAEYEQWDACLAKRVRAYLPVVDCLWALFCGLLIPHLAGEQRAEAHIQMRLRMMRCIGHAPR